MKRITVIIIDGKEVELESLTAEQRVEIAEELNRRALSVLGYQQMERALER